MHLSKVRHLGASHDLVDMDSEETRIRGYISVLTPTCSKACRLAVLLFPSSLAAVAAGVWHFPSAQWSLGSPTSLGWWQGLAVFISRGAHCHIRHCRCVDHFQQGRASKSHVSHS